MKAMAQKPEQNFTDEELMAFADGQCDPATAARIRVAAATDPAVGKRVEMFRSGASMLRMAFPPKPNAAADAKLEQLIRSAASKPAEPASNVVQFPKPAKVRPGFWPQAAAAAVVLVVALAGNYLLTTPGPGEKPQLASNPWQVAPDVQRILESLPSGTSGKAGGQEITMIASFKDRQGHICREFESSAGPANRSVALACKAENEAWRMVLQAAIPSATDAFVPAGSSQALEAYLAGAGLGDPLSAEEEKALLQR